MTKNHRLAWHGGVENVARLAVTRRFGRDGLLVAAELARDIMEPFVPMDTGALAASAVVSANAATGSVTYLRPYAAACYYGDDIAFKRGAHPLATAFWDKAAASLKSGELARRVGESV